MKPNMKTAFAGVALLSISVINGCKKETAAPPVVTNTNTTSNYNLGAFFSQNGVPIQTYNINALSGGSFTTPKGTVVNIPANAFNTSNGTAYTGNVTIKFRDIYTKSDMLLSNVPTNTSQGSPLKSGGEFFIKAVASNGSALQLNGSAPIKVKQPLNGWKLDSAMAPFSNGDTAIITGIAGGWGPAPWSDSVNYTALNYVFTLYTFTYPIDSGSWCNSDNSQYFSAYPQVQFTIQSSDDSINPANTNVYLLFNGINSMVHVYYGNTVSGIASFPYFYAPQGLKCTVVAIQSLSNGRLRSAFVPTTITSGGTVNFTGTPTTLSAFKTTLATYNN